MRRGLAFAIVLLLVVTVGCCKKYETALADLDKSVAVVEVSLHQTMDMANKAAKAAGEKEPLYDSKDIEARIRTCWEMRALIWSALLGEDVKYDLPVKEQPGLLYTMKDGKKTPVKGSE